MKSIAITLTADSVGHQVKLPLKRTYDVGPAVHRRYVTCTEVAGGTACTLRVLLPAGSDALTIGAYDAPAGAGHLLSQAIVREHVRKHRLNQFSEITLDAVPGGIDIVAGPGATGSVSSGFTLTGTSPVAFSLSALDTHGTPYGTHPGVPTIRAFALMPSVAAISLSGSTLTIDPQKAGTAKIGLYLVAPSGDGSAALTTMTATEPAGSTSLLVASTAGFGNGQTIVVDAGTANAEEVTISAVVTGMLTVSKTALAHASGAGVATKGSNGLGLVYVPLAVAIESTIVALGGLRVSRRVPDRRVFLGKSTFIEQSPVIPPASFGGSESVNFLGFDAANTLYNADTNVYTIDEFPFDAATQSSNPTTVRTISGNSLDGNTNAQIGFTVSSNGAIATAIDTSSSAGLNDPVGPQLVAFAPASTTSVLKHTFANTAGSDYSAGAIGTQPSVAIMTDRSGSLIGYARSRS